MRNININEVQHKLRLKIRYMQITPGGGGGKETIIGR